MYERPRSTPNHYDVGLFHSKFGLDNTIYHDPGPRELDPELICFRVKFLLEELLEFCSAVGITLYNDPVDSRVGVDHDGTLTADHAQAFDALIDLVYVAMGTAHFMGYPWQMGWDLVQRANMSKVRAQSDGSDSKRGSSFDVVKPEGWTPPDIEGLLACMGWDNNKENNR